MRRMVREEKSGRRFGLLYRFGGNRLMGKWNGLKV
jgi:hypothetical protein